MPASDSSFPDEATARAPASIGNVGVGYDVLGCAMGGVHDRVTVRRTEAPAVCIEGIEGIEGAGAPLPTDPEENTATAGLLRMIDEEGLGHGFAVRLEKGIPLAAGMGGSAASAVAGVVAANALLESPLDREALLRYALVGEAVASGAEHPDNVAPSLFGGLVLTREVDPPDVISVPVPERVRFVLVHPDRTIATRDARAKVPEKVPMADVVRQTAHLGAFVAGCYRNDLALIARSLRDWLVEPHRAGLVPGFHEVQAAAREAGALGCSLSGAGPSLFAWCDADAAPAVRAAMVEAFEQAGVEADGWAAAPDPAGAQVVNAPKKGRFPAADPE
jgi:homoserine kinase